MSKTSRLTWCKLNICIKYKTCENLSLIGRLSCEITMKEKKQPCHTKLCAFRCLISRPQILNLRSQGQIRGKLHLLHWLTKLRDINEIKNTLVIQSCVLSDARFWGLKIKFVKNCFLLENNIPFRGRRFSQCLILSTAPHYWLLNKVLCE